jgi:hypothetical protein
MIFGNLLIDICQLSTLHIINKRSSCHSAEWRRGNRKWKGSTGQKGDPDHGEHRAEREILMKGRTGKMGKPGRWGNREDGKKQDGKVSIIGDLTRKGETVGGGGVISRYGSGR